MAADLVGLVQNFGRFVGQMFAQQLHALGNFAVGKKELRHLRRRICIQPHRPIPHAQSVPEQVALLVEFLPHAHPHLFPVHPGYAHQLALPSGSHNFLILHAGKAAIDEPVTVGTPCQFVILTGPHRLRYD